MQKSEIDRIRESGGHMEIGTPDDTSPIEGMLTIGESLYVVKQQGIYVIKLADQIDPERTNATIPPVQQKIVPLGSDSMLVAKTLLTACELFSEKVLPKEFDTVKAKLHALDALKDLAAMGDIYTALQATEAHKVSEFNASARPKGALLLPSIAELDAVTKNFFQKADHVQRNLLSIVKLFYKKSANVSGIDDLVTHATKTYGLNDPLVKFVNDVSEILTLIRLTRNALEHPHPPSIHAVIADFSLRPDGAISRPSIEVFARGKHYESVPLIDIMGAIFEQLPFVFEGAMAALCEKHIVSFGGHKLHLIEMRNEHRGKLNKHVTYAYGIEINGQIARFG